jgi:hypothetical protein
MADKDNASGMKSAYELALERLEKQGVERPESLSPETQEKIAEVRRQAEARLAEMEILHRDSLGRSNPMSRHDDEDNYVRERRRIEDDRDRKIEKLRNG